MIGALDCFGVPHTPDNVNHKSYIDLIANYYKKLGLDVSYVNLHSLGCNRTEHLVSILEKDYTKAEYYAENKRMTKKAIDTKDVFPFSVHDTFLDDYYDNPSNPNMKITSHLSNCKKPIFFYSCGQMDFHKYVNMRSNDIILILPEITLHFKSNFSKTLDNIENTVKYIMKINLETQIYMFGVYPMFNDKIVRKMLSPIYKVVNKAVYNRFKEYSNVHFVDILNNINYVAPSDCHPNFEGQKYMGRQVLSLMKKE